MTKKCFHFIAVFACAAALALSCSPKPAVEEENDDTQEEQTEEPDVTLLKMKASVPVTDNWVFSGKPSFTVNIENNNEEAGVAQVKLGISTDITKKSVATVEQSLDIAAGSKKSVKIGVEEELPAGIYKASISVNKRSAGSFFFANKPFEIQSPPDTLSDFSQFWADAKAQLAAIDMNVSLTEIKSHSSQYAGSGRKVYLLQMNSVPDGLTGEPVVVRGYYCEPQDGKKHPVMLHFYGYDDQVPVYKPFCPSSGGSDYAELYMSTRGQVLNNRPASLREPDGFGDFTNTYGDWFAFHFGDRDSYYYRGAFMDCVQAVRFMATRPTSDMNNIYAEGSSQGGAFTYAAAALSDYPFRAIAPCVAFLGDFPDYFKIVSWPGNTAKQNQGKMSDKEMYEFLSYFDIKNLATRISAATMACSGLQDGTCPPHTNLSAFNNLKTPESDKQYYFYPQMGHEIPGDWSGRYSAFFKKHRE